MTSDARYQHKGLSGIGVPIWLGVIGLIFAFLLIRDFDYAHLFFSERETRTAEVLFVSLFAAPPGIFLVYSILGLVWLRLWPDRDEITRLQTRIIVLVSAIGLILWLISRADMIIFFITLFQIFYSVASMRVIRLHTDVEDHGRTMQWKLAAGMGFIVIYAIVIEMTNRSCLDYSQAKDVGLCSLFNFLLWTAIYPFVPIVGMAVGRALSRQVGKRQ